MSISDDTMPAWREPYRDADRLWTLHPAAGRVGREADRRGLERWSLLGALVPRVCCTIPAHARLVLRSGEPGDSPAEGASITLFAIIIGGPRTGKSSAVSAARAIVPLPGCDLPIGTGEGIERWLTEQSAAEAEADGSALPSIDETTIPTAHFSTTEGEDLAIELARLGSRIAVVARRAWMGESLGKLTGDRSRRSAVEPHRYRIAMTLACQLEQLAPIMAGAGLGTPQRFLFVPAGTRRPDPTVAERLMLPMVDWAAASGSPVAVSPGEPPAPFWIHQPPAAREAFSAAACRDESIDPFALTTWDADGEADIDADDGDHTLLHRMKIAAVLAVMDGRAQPTDLDWEAAGCVMGARDIAIKRGIEAAEQLAERDRHAVGRQRALISLETDGVRDAAREADGAVTGSRLVELIRARRSEGLPAYKRAELKAAITGPGARAMHREFAAVVGEMVHGGLLMRGPGGTLDLGPALGGDQATAAAPPTVPPVIASVSQLPAVQQQTRPTFKHTAAMTPGGVVVPMIAIVQEEA